jgi:serine/threonine protein kinase
MDSSWQDTVLTVPYNAGTTRTLGSYDLLIPLGTGGMASVWLARRKGTHGFQKILAVKLLHARLQSSGVHARMFLDEARITARIRHPNVVEIYDLGDQDGLLYQAMEWVDGEPLSALLRACQGKFPIPIAVHIGIQVAAGLHAAHQLRNDENIPLGLVHRDVSPQNILIGFDGGVKVVDFGVAKAACNAELTVIGQIKGKVAYMSPEQASGQPVDRRTDIFVLGVVLYLMITGKHPFRGETEAETIRRLSDPRFAVALLELSPEIPQALRDVLREATHKDPDDRYASMADLMRALEATLPPRDRITAEDLGAFMRSRLGEVRIHRRNAIREALRALEEEWPAPGRSPTLPPPPSVRLEQGSTPARVTSNAAMVVSTPRPQLLPARGRAAPMILLVGMTSALGGALGFVGSRSVSTAATEAPFATSSRAAMPDVAQASAPPRERGVLVEAPARNPRGLVPCGPAWPAKERATPVVSGKSGEGGGGKGVGDAADP